VISDTHAQGRGNLAETKPFLLEGGLDGPFGFSGMGGRRSVLPSGFGPCQSGPYPLLDHRALEFGEHAQHLKHRLPGRR
jgi:hypothetical protein